MLPSTWLSGMQFRLPGTPSSALLSDSSWIHFFIEKDVETQGHVYQPLGTSKSPSLQLTFVENQG